jgi:hypothetical protein
MSGDLSLCRWRIHSELPMPEVAQWQYGNRPRDVVISYAACADVEPPSSARQLSLLTHVCATSGWYLRVPGIATIRAREGVEVRIARGNCAGGEDIKPFILGPVLQAIARQRGMLTLQATAVAYGDGAVALCGATGVGKSAIGYALSRRGCLLISDGLSIGAIQADQPHMSVVATLPAFHFWRAAVHSLRISAAEVAPASIGVPKYYHRVDAAAFDAMASVPLRHMVIVRRSGKPAETIGDPTQAARLIRRQFLLDDPYPNEAESHALGALARRLASMLKVHVVAATDDRAAAVLIERLLD